MASIKGGCLLVVHTHFPYCMQMPRAKLTYALLIKTLLMKGSSTITNGKSVLYDSLWLGGPQEAFRITCH